MKHHQILAVFLAVMTSLWVSSAVAKPAYLTEIPTATFNCNTCHDGAPSLATTNAFADDFKAAGYTWTMELCQKDTDGDGASNAGDLLATAQPKKRPRRASTSSRSVVAGDGNVVEADFATAPK